MRSPAAISFPVSFRRPPAVPCRQASARGRRLSAMLLCFALLAGGTPAAAQAEPQSTPAPAASPTTHATLIGIGASYQQDTYLSPLQYSGVQLSLLHETLRPTRLLGDRIYAQGLFQLNLTYSDNDAGNANFLGGQVRYDHAMLGHWRPGRRWLLMAGPQLGAHLGFLYNTRNGNNPAQALAGIRLSVAAGAVYRFHLWQRHFALRDHLDCALLGAMFSPAYGQSYYELFALGHTDHNILATHPANARSLRNNLTLDIPCRNATLRVGYFLDIQESHVNHIRHSDYSVGFMLGWVRHLSRHKSGRTVPEGFIL